MAASSSARRLITYGEAADSIGQDFALFIKQHLDFWVGDARVKGCPTFNTIVVNGVTGEPGESVFRNEGSIALNQWQVFKLSWFLGGTLTLKELIEAAIPIRYALLRSTGGSLWLAQSPRQQDSVSGTIERHGDMRWICLSWQYSSISREIAVYFLPRNISLANAVYGKAAQTFWRSTFLRIKFGWLKLRRRLLQKSWLNARFLLKSMSLAFGRN